MRNTGWKVARAASFLLYYSGGLRLFERIARGKRPAPRCTVLSYHRVADDRPGYRDISVSPATLRSHLAYLRRRGYGFLSLSEYHAWLSGERVLECDSVLVTFDDGYRDNYSAAFPVLREFGIPAAVFLCTGPIETGTLLWWDRVAGAVRALRDAGEASAPAGPDLPAEIAEALRAGLEGDTRRASLAIGDLVDLLKASPAEDRERTIAALERLAPPLHAGDLMLTWDMVREMHAAGIGFGAHSVTHPAFAGLSAEEARSEIAGSVSAIERELGEPVTAFAYPYGKEHFIGASTAAALRASGIRWAYTTENGWNAPGADPLALRRNGMRDVPAYVLAARVAGVFEHPALAGLRSRVEGRFSK
jgi:peptidoglycan/xylan/chitin deacetylase (PgdA/CDA1 family)